MHEDVIASEAPYAQIAIEYEIEMLSVRYGPGFVAQCARRLPRALLSGLSFIREHVASYSAVKESTLIARRGRNAVGRACPRRPRWGS